MSMYSYLYLHVINWRIIISTSILGVDGVLVLIWFAVNLAGSLVNEILKVIQCAFVRQRRRKSVEMLPESSSLET